MCRFSLTKLKELNCHQRTTVYKPNAHIKSLEKPYANSGVRYQLLIVKFVLLLCNEMMEL